MSLPEEAGQSTSFAVNEELEESERDLTRKIVLHVYDDESKEFTSLTTYHGMVRIYNSATWPSLIFWCLVVVSCLTLFMIHSGYLVEFYISHPTYLDTKHITNHVPSKVLPVFTFCRRAGPIDVWHQLKADSIVHDLLLQHGPSCDDFFVRLRVNGEDVSDLCSVHARQLISEFGVCFTLESLPLKIQDELEVVVHTPPGTGELAFEIHNQRTATNLFAHGIRTVSGTHLASKFSIHWQRFLDKDNWGVCQPTQTDNLATLEHCQQNCLRQFLVPRCRCLPYYLAQSPQMECSWNQTINCIFPELKKLRHCNCSVPCNRISYRLETSSITKLPDRQSNVTKLSLTFKDRTLIYQEQKQRFKTVDALSFVGGSMGLFLGMSCITVMEVFMFLFKLVWGNINNRRHKNFLSNMLGEPVRPMLNDDPDVRGSHEQIVITQTCNARINGLSTDGGQSHGRMEPLTFHIRQRSASKRLSIQISSGTESEKHVMCPTKRFRTSGNSLLNSFEHAESFTRAPKLTKEHSYNSVGIGSF